MKHYERIGQIYQDYQDLHSVVTGYLHGETARKSRILQQDAYTAALGRRCSILEPAEQMAGPEDLFDAYSLQHRSPQMEGGEAREICG